jgi:hypothetical protein
MPCSQSLKNSLWSTQTWWVSRMMVIESVPTGNENVRLRMMMLWTPSSSSPPPVNPPEVPTPTMVLSEATST